MMWALVLLAVSEVCPGMGFRLTDSESCRYQSMGPSGPFCVSDQPRCGDAMGKWSVFKDSQNQILFRFRVREWSRNSFVLKTDEWRGQMSKVLKPLDSNGVYRKLLLNERVAATSDSLLRELGWVHVLTAAGIHLWFLWGCVLWVCERLSLLFRFSPQNQRRYFFAIMFGVILVCLILSGFRLGFIRPLFLFSVRAWTRWNGIRISAVSLLLIMSIVEGMLFGFGNHGQSHYFLSVMGTYLAVFSMPKHYKRFQKALWISWGSFFGVTIFDFYFGGRVAPFTVILNLVSFPLYVMVIYPLLLLFSVFWILELPHFWILQILKHLDEVTLWFQDYSNRIPGWIWGVERNGSNYFILATVIFIPLLVGPLVLGSFRKWIVLTIAFLIFGVRISTDWFDRGLSEGCGCALKVEALDVAQGDATWVQFQTKNGKILNGMIDVGSERAWSRTRWLEYWMRRGVHRLDFVLLTHLDEDHSGGLKKLQSLIPIQCVVSIGQMNDLNCVPFTWKQFRLNSQSGRRVRNGEMIAWVLPLGLRDRMFGFGDASQKLEEQALPWFEDQKSRIGERNGLTLFRGFHHGSKTSGSEYLLQRLSVDEAWISSAWMGQYGHPHFELLNRFKSHGVQLKRGDRMGLLSYESKNKLK